MELPKKPELKREYKQGPYGEIVEQLTSDSEALWSRYLTELNFAKRAIYATVNDTGTDPSTKEL